MRILVAVLLFAGWPAIVVGQVPSELTKRLEEVDSKFESAKQSAEDVYRDQIAKLNESRLTSLRQMLIEYTKGGDLDSAVTIRDRIKEMEAQPTSQLPSPFVNEKQRRFVSHISQMYWVPPSNAAGWISNGPNGVVFRSDGFVVPIENATAFDKTSDHRWAAVDLSHIVVFHKLGYVDVFTVLKNDTLQYDHYGKSDGHDSLDFRANLLPLTKGRSK